MKPFFDEPKPKSTSQRLSTAHTADGKKMACLRDTATRHRNTPLYPKGLGEKEAIGANQLRRKAFWVSIDGS